MPATPQFFFRTTAAQYARYRLGYSEALIGRVLAATGTRPGDRVLDLGAGPGLLALPFAQAGMAVAAVEPEAEMRAALAAAADAAGLAVDIRAGSSFALPEGIGPFRLVVMGRAFHWMDRAATAAALDRLIEPDGAVVLFEDETLKTCENRWYDALNAVAARYGADEAPHRVARAAPDYRSHESILLDSPFSRLETVGEIVARTLSADDIVGLTRTLSVTSSLALGERTAAFETDLRAALQALSPQGAFRELAEMRALIARRA